MQGRDPETTDERTQETARLRQEVEERTAQMVSIQEEIRLRNSRLAAFAACLTETGRASVYLPDGFPFCASPHLSL